MNLSLHVSDGGELTLYLTTNEITRPRSEPLYSKCNSQYFPLAREFSKVDFNEILYIFNHKNYLFLKTLCVNRNECFALFASAGAYTAVGFTCDSLQNLRAEINKCWENGEIVCALAKDGNQRFFGQKLANSDVSQSLIAIKNLDDIMLSEKSRVQACFHKNSKYWLLVTHYQQKQKPQKILMFGTGRDWQQELFRIDRRTITCMCFNANGDESMVICEDWGLSVSTHERRVIDGVRSIWRKFLGQEHPWVNITDITQLDRCLSLTLDCSDSFFVEKALSIPLK